MNAPQPNFRDALRALDDALQQSPVPLAPPPWTRRASRWPVYQLPAVAAAAALALWAGWPSPVSAPPEVTQVAFSPDRCMPAVITPKLTLTKGCTLDVSHPDLTIVALADTRIEHTQRGFVVKQGELRFDVAPGPTPTRVWVAGGHIQGLGAQFVVQQDPAGQGAVRLQKGRIEFIAPDSPSIQLEAGAVHAWLAPSPALPPAEWSKARIEQEVAAASRARAEGAFELARQRLSQLLKAPVGEPVAEIMSFELGGLLENKLRDHAAACTHWRGHARRFGGGQYEEQVRDRINRCAEGNSAEAGE